VVEHDEDIIAQADYILDVGPGAGKYGGKIIAEGTPKDIMKHPDSITGQFLSGRRKIEIRKERRKGNGKQLVIKGAREHNLRNLTVEIPLGILTCVTGVSGSGKSSLINHILVKKLTHDLNKAKTVAGEHDEILGIE